MGGSWRLTFAWCYFPFHKILHRRGKEKTFLTIWTKLIFTHVYEIWSRVRGELSKTVWIIDQMFGCFVNIKCWVIAGGYCGSHWGPHAYRVFSIYFITKTRLSWLFIHIVCTFIIYNLYASGCYPEPSRVSTDKVPFRGDGGWWQIALVSRLNKSSFLPQFRFLEKCGLKLFRAATLKPRMIERYGFVLLDRNRITWIYRLVSGPPPRVN